jgi:hypothetical protein
MVIGGQPGCGDFGNLNYGVTDTSPWGLGSCLGSAQVVASRAVFLSSFQVLLDLMSWSNDTPMTRSRPAP